MGMAIARPRGMAVLQLAKLYIINAFKAVGQKGFSHRNRSYTQKWLVKQAHDLP